MASPAPDNGTPPRVTVGMTLFNVERYLPGALDSLLTQEFGDFEIVACDNQSTDATWDIIRAYAARDRRVRAYRNETNVGQAANFQRVVESARGELFRLHSHDDLAEPGLLRACVAALDAAGPGAVLAFPRTRIIDAEGRAVCSWRDPIDLRSLWAWRRVGRFAAGWHLCNEFNALIRTDALRRTHLLLDSVVSPDVVLLTELAALGQFVEVPEELFLRRLHPAGTHQGTRTLDEIASFLEPQAARRRPTRFALTRETVRVLWDSPLPTGTRASTVAAFIARYTGRRIQGRLRRDANRLLRRPARRAPWEVSL